MQQPVRPRRLKTHYGLMALMVLLNLDKYLVRYLPAGAKPLMSADLGLTDYQTGSLYTAFLITYLFVCPVVGVLADGRAVPKKLLMFLSVVTWSLATSATSLCTNYEGLLVTRVVCGVAECIFSTMGSSFIPDIVVPSQRTKAVAWYYAASPVGAAIGYAASATMGEKLGWRLAFGLMGLFGFAALPLLFIREPTIGALDAAAEQQQSAAASLESHAADPRTPLMSKQKLQQQSGDGEEEAEDHSSETCHCHCSGARAVRFIKDMRVFLGAEYLASLIGYAVSGFALAGLDDWLTTFLHRYQHITVSAAGTVNGIVVIIGGLLGNFLGAAGSDLTRRCFHKQPEMLFSSLAMVVAAACCAAALYFPLAPDATKFDWRCACVAVLWGCVYAFGTAYQSPMVTYIINCVPPSLRSRSSAIMHFVGELPSSSIVGAVSDQSNDLRQALVIIPFSMFVAYLVWFLGALIIKPSPFHQRLNEATQQELRRNRPHPSAPSVQ